MGDAQISRDRKQEESSLHSRGGLGGRARVRVQQGSRFPVGASSAGGESEEVGGFEERGAVDDSAGAPPFSDDFSAPVDLS